MSPFLSVLAKVSAKTCGGKTFKLNFKSAPPSLVLADTLSKKLLDKRGGIQMRRTLISMSFVTIIVILTVIPARASWVSEMLFGRHREYREAGITYAVDEKIPAAWAKDSVLSTRYWKEGAPVFAGTVLRIGVFLNTGSEDGRKFAICVSDESAVIGDYSGDPKAKLPKDKNGLGGLKVLGTFEGKYGLVEWNTGAVEPGTIFLYTYALKGRKYEKFSEQAVAIQIAPSLTDVIPAMQNEPDDVLRQWGLEGYPTLEEVVGEVGSKPARFDLVLTDGGSMRDVNIGGQPAVGRLLGVFTKDMLAGVVRVDSFDGTSVRSNSSSKFLKTLLGRERELQLAWVVRAEVYSTKGNHPMTAEQYHHLLTFPDGPIGSPTFGLRNMIYEMFQAGVVHLKEPFGKNTSLDYQQMYQNWTAQKHTYILAPAPETYVPQVKMKYSRVVRLSSGGVPIIKVESASINRTDSAGLWNGLAFIIGQRARRPDINNTSSSATGGAGGSATGGNATATGGNATNNAPVTVNQQQQQQQ